MNPKSLRLRLAVAAAITISIALIFAGVGLTRLFERHVVRRVELELASYLRQLAANLSFAADGTMKLTRPPNDPRFDTPLSGLYWQIEDDATRATLRSRSLWDHFIDLPRNPHDERELHRYVLNGPGGQKIVTAERRVYTGKDGKSGLVRIAAALNQREVLDARRAFATDVTYFLALLAAFLLLAVWVQIVIGLRPLEAVRRSIAAIRSGKQPRIDVDEPAEVMPLVVEVNSLLDGQEKSLKRARTRAADLAHGLKTPLTVLTSVAEELRQKGDGALASEVDELAGAMLRHISRDLSRSRLQGAARGQSLSSMVRPVAQGVIRTLAHSPKGRQIDWTVDIPDEAVAAIHSDDLAELLGALLENAVKWAEKKVAITCKTSAPLRILIEDDGPGVSPAKLQQLGRRGVRLDESVEGSGLGLAIATDIADAYGMSLEFGNREPQGFRVVIDHPARK